MVWILLGMSSISFSNTVQWLICETFPVKCLLCKWHRILLKIKTQIAKTPGFTWIRCQSNIKVLDWYPIDVKHLGYLGTCAGNSYRQLGNKPYQNQPWLTSVPPNGSTRWQWVNSLAPGRPRSHFKSTIFNLVLLIAIFTSSKDNALRQMWRDLTNDKSTLVQVMAWYHQATSHYLSQCWPSSMSQYGVNRPQWVNIWLL